MINSEVLGWKKEEEEGLANAVTLLLRIIYIAFVPTYTCMGIRTLNFEGFN